MSDASQFKDLVRRVRRGDAQAAADLVRTYETEIRIVARVRLSDPKLRRVLDSVDVCQSVLANFFVRAASGQFELDTPEQLLSLLSHMIRNKVTDHARRQQAARRDVRKTTGDVHELEIAGSQETPSQLVARDELIGEAPIPLPPRRLHNGIAPLTNSPQFTLIL